MNRKIKYLLCSLVMLLIGLVCSPTMLVSADADVENPIIVSGITAQLEGGYQEGDEIIFDPDLFEFTDNVDSSETLKQDANWDISITGPDGLSVSNIGEVGEYMYRLLLVGEYTITLTVTDSSSNSAVETKVIKVLSDSAVELKYQRGFAISTTEISDSKLYNALLDVLIDFAETRGDRLNPNSFDTLYSESFLNIGFTSLVIHDRNISSLAGINSLRLDDLESITITGNKLTEVKSEYFEDATNLTSINLASNKITKCDLSSIKTLTYLNLASNAIETLDLSHCNGSTVDINLAGNNFASLDDIELPRADKINLNMIGNNLSEVEEGYFDLDKLTLNLGVQGIKNLTDASKVDTTSGFRYYKSNIEGLAIDVYSAVGAIDTKVKTLSDADIAEGSNYIDVVLPVGDYYYEYTLNGEPVYKKYNVETNYYLSQDFTALPTKPTYQFEHKGKMYDTLGKVTGAVTVHISTVDEGTIYYNINGGEWIEGDKIVYDVGGSVSIRIKVVVGDYESEEASIFLRTSLNTVVPDALMFFLILAFTIILFVVVVPIISKKFFRK